MNDIAVFGAGAFGTALAISLVQSGRSVTLCGRNPASIDLMRGSRENARALPGVALPESLTLSSDPSASSASVNLIAVPTQKLAEFLAEHSGTLDGRTLVLCCKGIDRASGKRPSELARKACPASAVSVLTGPSFAQDIAIGLPTALTLAIEDQDRGLQALLSTPNLRLYLTDDVIGAELGGALKNVIALAAGLTVGAGLGESARAAVITRGFAEMVRFAAAQGARRETLSGLSGLGDLVLTCTSEKSRNFAAGLAIGAGREIDPNATIEGLATARAVGASPIAKDVDMPLSQMVARIAAGEMDVAAAAEVLMSRPLKKE